ncbi:hypothetical protein [Colwellia sp. E2M01]|uniref:hypothetical protein n=1 Tax=Colwellia sp. E2M01 TaxID=2841561 RepID=UPI001C08856D|nr:hypothetical protein [Colwellia sp. E2M01]MBU2872098.1 hypothetical protein [Colwellia sp. E2M01]
MFPLIMMITGFSLCIYNLCQGYGYIKIKKSDGMEPEELAKKKQMLKFGSIPMFGIGVIYALELLGIW